jgi:hypothetical protein
MWRRVIGLDTIATYYSPFTDSMLDKFVVKISKFRSIIGSDCSAFAAEGRPRALEPNGALSKLDEVLYSNKKRKRHPGKQYCL